MERIWECLKPYGYNPSMRKWLECYTIHRQDTHPSHLMNEIGSKEYKEWLTIIWLKNKIFVKAQLWSWLAWVQKGAKACRGEGSHDWQLGRWKSPSWSCYIYHMQESFYLTELSWCLGMHEPIQLSSLNNLFENLTFRKRIGLLGALMSLILSFYGTYSKILLIDVIYFQDYHRN